MKSLLIVVVGILAGCASGPTSETTPGMTLFYRHGEVRAIDLLLRITTSQRLPDGAWKITAQGSFESKDFGCILSIPARWSDDTRFSGVKRADVVFSDAAGGRILDSLVQRHYGKEPSVFARSGFGVISLDSVDRVDREKFEFQGFANDPDEGEFGMLQCLAFVDVPRRYVKLAFLVEGYGGSPPDEVFKWLQKRANQSPEPTVTSVTPRADARVAPAMTVAHL
jgi:hypothetical protein